VGLAGALSNYTDRTQLRRNSGIIFTKTDASVLRYAGYFARIEQIDAPDADGWVPVSLRFDIEKAACAYVLGFGAQMEVIEPLELRDRVLQVAKETIARYINVE
jgi:predicted DNA-binding transcriptional regulator YafY